MSLLVSAGAMLQCSFGAAPSSLMVLPKNRVMSTTPTANILDNIPFMNVMPFGMCSSMSNPVVAAATAAALGAMTPMPCIPATTAPWAPGVPTVLVGSMPAVDMSCKLMCMWGGVIQVVGPSQSTVMGG